MCESFIIAWKNDTILPQVYWSHPTVYMISATRRKIDISLGSQLKRGYDKIKTSSHDLE